MTGNKLLIGLTLVLVAAMFIGGVYYPDNLFVSIVEDTTPAYAGVRLFTIALLVSLLLTHPPRSIALRAVIGGWSVVLAAVSLQHFFTYQMHILDLVVFLEVAIILGIEALETRRNIPVSHQPTPTERVRVIST